jgi:plasmid stabilization system protein ParE
VSRRIIVRPLAKADLWEAQDWYDRQRPGLGDDFRAAIDSLLQRVSEFPLAYPRVYRGIRRAGARRFPYLVYYAVTSDAVVVLACLHSSRDPALFKSRL